MTELPPTPTLKCVIAWSNRRHLCDIVRDALESIVSPDEMRRLGEEAYVVSTSEEPAALRDAVRQSLIDDEAVVVIEFERWSGYGKALDSAWLLRRGH